jgi:hypothetical protein
VLAGRADATVAKAKAREAKVTMELKERMVKGVWGVERDSVVDGVVGFPEPFELAFSRTRHNLLSSYEKCRFCQG